MSSTGQDAGTSSYPVPSIDELGNSVEMPAAAAAAAPPFCKDWPLVKSVLSQIPTFIKNPWVAAAVTVITQAVDRFVCK